MCKGGCLRQVGHWLTHEFSVCCLNCKWRHELVETLRVGFIFLVITQVARNNAWRRWVHSQCSSNCRHVLSFKERVARPRALKFEVATHKNCTLVRQLLSFLVARSRAFWKQVHEKLLVRIKIPFFFEGQYLNDSIYSLQVFFLVWAWHLHLVEHAHSLFCSFLCWSKVKELL